MKFGEVPVAESEGAILVHSLRLGTTALKKGRTLSAADTDAITGAGIEEITVVRLEPGDVREDPAADRIAAAIAGSGIATAAGFTGRANLFAERKGLLVFDRDRLDRLNLIDEAVTLGTLPPYAVVEPRQMVATVKIIPFAVQEDVVTRCATIASQGGELLRVAAFRPLTVGLIQTRLPGLKETTLDKTRSVTQGRLDALGCVLALERRCAHKSKDLAAEIAAAIGGVDLLLIHGASAIVDRRDVIPAAIEAAGGTVDHFGMPVDPGNLLLLGRLGERPVLGLPGCARSPKVNGFDWVLRRLIADLPVDGADIMRMGAGGLLKEIPTRPQPRDEPAVVPRAPRVAALVLAAGRSSRMGGANKLLTEVEGRAMVARAIDAALASRARPVLIVVGHEAARLKAVIGDRPVAVVENPAFATGMASSLKAGLQALPGEVDAVVVCLADMPRVGPEVLDRLISAFNPLEGRAICVPTWEGKRGNPVLWARRFIPEMIGLAGDVGARHLIGQYGELVAEVAMLDDGVLLDIDTPEALAHLRQRPA